MTAKLLEPVAVSRPQFSHRYEVYSPKVGRRITLFSWDAVQLWTLFEAQPAVGFFCERPGLVSHKRRWRLADFWVQRDGQSEIWVLPDMELTPVESAPRIPASLVGTVLHSDSSLLNEQAMLIRNWQAILPYVVSNRREIGAAQKRRILACCQQVHALVDIERAELPADPVITRSTTFELTRCGELLAQDLHSHVLGPGSRFIAA